MAKSSKLSEMQEENQIKLELTPMIDMSFLILIFFMCLPFKTLEGKMQAFLPTNKGINPTPQDPIQEYKLQVMVAPRLEETRMWGPKGYEVPVKMPTTVVYRQGDQETSDIDTVHSWIKQWKQAAPADTEVKGEIKAGEKVPHKFVVAVLNKFAQEKVDKVDFYGTAIPPKELRQVTVLPYPTTKFGVAQDG